MSGCWRCECGMKNCDLDECQNPKCTHKCTICGTHTNDHMVNAAGLKKALCPACYTNGMFSFYSNEFKYVQAQPTGGAQ